MFHIFLFPAIVLLPLQGCSFHTGHAALTQQNGLHSAAHHYDEFWSCRQRCLAQQWEYHLHGLSSLLFHPARIPLPFLDRFMLKISSGIVLIGRPFFVCDQFYSTRPQQLHGERRTTSWRSCHNDVRRHGLTHHIFVYASSKIGLVRHSQLPKNKGQSPVHFRLMKYLLRTGQSRFHCALPILSLQSKHQTQIQNIHRM